MTSDRIVLLVIWLGIGLQQMQSYVSRYGPVPKALWVCIPFFIVIWPMMLILAITGDMIFGYNPKIYDTKPWRLDSKDKWFNE